MPRNQDQNLESTQHYYTARPDVAHDPGLITYTFAGKTLRLHTDAGVFSKHRVDYGSDLLIRSVPPLTGNVLDMGCGYGAIGLSLAAANTAAQFTLVDINERAAALAKQNQKDNNLSNVKILTGDGFTAVPNQMFDAVVINPPIRAGKAVIYRLFEDAHAALASGGALYVVIQKKQGAPSAKAFLSDLFGSCETLGRGAGFWILQSVKN